MLRDSLRTRMATGLLLAVTLAGIACAARTDVQKLGDAARLIAAFTADEADSIPTELIARARGIAIFPDMLRGGFLLGGRRGRGVILIRGADGRWSSPAFINLTAGSIGWQVGGETMDLVLVFANDNAIKNISNGKFTIGGDAAAVAGPLGKRATMAVTFRAEVFSYVRSRGLFAGAAFEGARLRLDDDANREFYGAPGYALAPIDGATPAEATALAALLDDLAAGLPVRPVERAVERTEEAPAESAAKTFPLGD